MAKKNKKIDLGFDIEDLKSSSNGIDNLLYGSEKKSKIFLLLALKFINEDKTAIQCREISNILSFNPNFVNSVLNAFVRVNILTQIKKSSKEVYYVAKDFQKEIFTNDEYLDIAKKTMGINLIGDDE